jgi:hypothetical protein
LEKLQLLCHHFMIPTRAEVYVGVYTTTKESLDDVDDLMELSDGRKIAFGRMGFVTFDDGRAGQYRARELKSVHTGGAEADCLRLVFHESYRNHLNVFAQVSLVAVNILGRREGESVQGAEAVELGLEDELCQDPQLMQWMRAAIQTKNQCVESNLVLLAQFIMVV